MPILHRFLHRRSYYFFTASPPLLRISVDSARREMTIPCQKVMKTTPTGKGERVVRGIQDINTEIRITFWSRQKMTYP